MMRYLFYFERTITLKLSGQFGTGVRLLEQCITSKANKLFDFGWECGD